MTSKPGKRLRVHSHRTSLSPSEERRKVRESILNAFRKRFEESPEESGALVVSGTSQSNQNMSTSQESGKESKKLRESNRGEDSPKHAIGSLVISETGTKLEEDEIMNLSIRRKKRKTRAERNKLREKTKSMDKPSEMKRHIAMANNMMSNVPDRTYGKEKAACMITHNRLTKRLGLFNQGKKSNTVLRDGINLPANLQQVAEEDIKKIIGKPEKNAISNSQEVQSTSKTPMSTKSAYSLHRSHGSSPSGLMAVDEDEATPDVCLSIPSTPDIAAVMEKLTLHVQPKKYFAGKDRLQSVVSELCKLIRQNCPSLVSDAETPIKTASNIQVSSEVICRDLHSSLPPTSRSTEPRSVKLPNKLCYEEQSGSGLVRLYDPIADATMFATTTHDNTTLSHSYNLRNARGHPTDMGSHSSDPRDDLYKIPHHSIIFQKAHRPLVGQGRLERTAREHSITSKRTPAATTSKLEESLQLANHQDPYVRAGPSFADPCHAMMDSSYSTDLYPQDRYSAAHGTYVLSHQQPVFPQKQCAVVTQMLYPHQDPTNLLYKCQTRSQRKSVDLLDEMDMEFQDYAEQREHQRQEPARSHKEADNTNFWIPRPTALLASPSPPQQLYPRRLY